MKSLIPIFSESEAGLEKVKSLTDSVQSQEGSKKFPILKFDTKVSEVLKIAVFEVFVSFRSVGKLCNLLLLWNRDSHDTPTAEFQLLT